MKSFYNYIRYRMIPVTDDWFPCFSGNQIRVSLSIYNQNGRHYCTLTAWGKDDFGLEKEHISNTKEENEAKFHEWEKDFESIPDFVNKEWFLARGYKEI